MERGSLSRRDFLKATAGVGVAAVIGGVSGCSESAPKREVPLTENALRAAETKAWNAFGYRKEIPSPPENLMTALDTAHHRGYTTLEAHYLPALTLTEKTNEYHGWEKQPGKLFWEELHKRRGRDSQGKPEITMGGYWVLVDAINDDKIGTDRKFPDYWNATKETPYTYSDDPLGGVLTELRTTNTTLSNVKKDTSRCEFSWNELHQLVLPKIGKEFGLTEQGGKVRLMTGTEFNILGNVFYPEWDDSVADQLIETWTYGIALSPRPEENDVASVAEDLTNITVPFTSLSFRSSKTAFRPFVVFPH